jgi:ABC-type uncharacterized transport system permease subunit
MTNSEESIHKLEAMSNEKLMDVCRNGTFYGYDEEIIRQASLLLEGRGIQLSEIKMGTTNRSSEMLNAIEIKNSYSRLSIAALIGYTIIISVNFLNSFAEQYPLIYLAIYLLAFLGFVGCLVGSVIRLTQFFKAINKSDSTGEVLLYLLVGIPLYILVFLYFLPRMNSLLKEHSRKAT